MFERMVHRTVSQEEIFCLFTTSLAHTNTGLSTNTPLNTGLSKGLPKGGLARPAPNLGELRVHHLGGSHASCLVYLPFINQSLASIHGLVGGPRLGFHHLQGLHAWEGRIWRLQSSASCQDHSAGLRQTGVHIHLRPGEKNSQSQYTEKLCRPHPAKPHLACSQLPGSANSLCCHFPFS